jgi:uncharacterized DUF497 family protein
MRYSWDEEKASRNLALHGIAFEDAVRIFEGSTVERVDERFDYDERRVYAIGVVNGLEITVIIPTGRKTRGGSSPRGDRSRTKDATIGET